MDIQHLDTARRAAHAAWVAAGSPDKGELRDALDAAARAYAAAKKKGAVSEPAVGVSARLKEIEAERAARKAEADKARRALAAIRAAFSWPRCGENFPTTAAEKAAEKWAIEAHGSLDAALAAHEVCS